MINGQMCLVKVSLYMPWILQLKFVQFPNSFNSRFVLRPIAIFARNKRGEPPAEVLRQRRERARATVLSIR